MCVCVLEIFVLKIFKLRDYFERLLGWLDHWLSHMLDCIYVRVFLLLKNCFKKLAQHFLDTLLSVELLKPFSYCNLDSSSIPGGSIENAPASSIASRYLVDRLSFCSWIWFLVAWYLLDTSIVDDLFLDTYLESFLDTSRYLICGALLKVLFKPPRMIHFSFLRSLSICPCLFFSRTLSFHSNCVPQDFFKLFQVFLHLVSF